MCSIADMRWYICKVNYDLFNYGFFLSFIFISGGDDSNNMLNTQCVEDTNQRQVHLYKEI